MTKNPPVYFLMGPTASGKTALAMELVAQGPFEIISVDSAMVYRGMDIGTGKPTSEELRKAPHHLVDILDPSQAYSAADFVSDALEHIKAAHRKNKIPLLVGGTMLYFHALRYGLSALPEADQSLRRELEQQPLAELYQRLQQIDPIAAQRIHPNDPQRIHRAIEVYELQGKPLSELCSQAAATEFLYPIYGVALLPNDRSLLHQRIEQRFVQMLEQGLVAEVETLFARKDLHEDLPAMRAVGYRQVWQYLKANIDKDTMIATAQAATRQLAKRQLTWLRRWQDMTVVDIFEPQKALKLFLAHSKSID